MSDFKRKLKGALDILLEEDEDGEVTATVAVNPRRRRPLEDSDIDDFMLSAESRDDPLWSEIEGYLKGDLRRRYPVRSAKLLKELRWLRKRAERDGLDWGKR